MKHNYMSWLGPYQILLKLLLVGLAILSLSRLGLAIWQWDRVTSAVNLPLFFIQGVRADLIMLGMLIAPLALLMPLLVNKYTWRFWQKLVWVWGTFIVILVVFMETATPAFIMQYDLRPNRLFVEYLQYPKEVFSTLWEGFRVPLILGVSLTIIAGILFSTMLKKWLSQYRLDWPVWKLWLTWPLLVLLLVVMIRSTMAHRPANPAIFAITSDAMVNSLIINSSWSVYFAIYNMQHEAEAGEVYGSLTDDEIMAEMDQNYPWLNADPDAPFPTLNKRESSITRDKPLNLVIILEESMGATFVKSLGGEHAVTPELEKLKDKGWWFEQLYATGTRSVRGIEATISGFLPTPARSVVKLSLSQQNFFTIADLLNHKGYFTEFIYGGESHFDNMASFFIGNGFESVIDQDNYQNPVFKGSWGVSDEDLLNKAHNRISEMHQKGQPYFSLVFTSSNHSPYEFPDGRIDLEGSEKQTDLNAVKYADYALGEFFDKAMQSDYWQNTLFLVIADHDLNVYGDALVPIERFQIPGLILGADIKPKRIKTVASQIDMAPTLLSLMGISAETPMIGRDLSRPEEHQSTGRALMQFADYFALMQGEKVTILRPQKQALEGHYSPDTRQLEILGPAEEEDAHEALAHVLLPSWLYRQQRYDMPLGHPAYR
ncbi:LTA synthase family protein [Methylophaga nitratireducenticrescens]|nr:LTA synthase family protein [Methylophaga nitratireducenticrescens]